MAKFDITHWQDLIYDPGYPHDAYDPQMTMHRIDRPHSTIVTLMTELNRNGYLYLNFEKGFILMKSAIITVRTVEE